MSEVRAIGDRTNNAQLMADCFALGYLPDSVLDATYGEGRFWTQYRPEKLTANDLDMGSTAEFHYDFRNLPFSDRFYGTVVFDPPYKLNGTSTGIGPSALDNGYGVGGKYSSVQAKMELITDGLRECARVASRYVLVKCQDQVVSGNVVWQTISLANFGMFAGPNLALVDMLHVQGYRQQPPGRRQLHSRRDYSTLLVFEVTP